MGSVRASLEENIEQAKQTMAALAQSGISIDAVTAKLVEEGVQLFADAFDKLLGAMARKRAANLGEKLDGQTYKLPAGFEKMIAASLELWRHDGNVRRLWAGDARLWTGTDEAKWLGWLKIAGEQRKRIGALSSLADDIAREGFAHILLLGMGGSSLGPEVFAETFGRQQGYPELLVLDSTDPAQIRTIESKIDPARALFIVSSKSGSTLEPNILKQYFFECAKRAVGADKAGSRFIAVTDPGSTLQKIAERDRFRHIAFGIPSIGGRYSVLSDFGMMPAAVMGLDIGRLLSATQKMVRSCGADVPPADNPGVVLGTVLGVLGRSGRDKITIVASPGIADFGAWLEQLLAELTGKQGKGLIPVDAEPLGAPGVYGRIVYLSISSCQVRLIRRRMTRSPRSNARASRSCASASPIAITLARNFFAGSLPRQSLVQSSASTHSINPMSRPARSRRASSPPHTSGPGNCRRKRRCWRRPVLRSLPTRRTARRF